MLATAFVALALSVAAPATSATGLHGIVMRGPTTPTCQPDVSCDRPAAHVRLTFSRNTFSRSVVTRETGRYRVILPAGSYAVRIVGARFGFTPRTADVIAGRVRALNFSIDTGIR